MRANFGFKHVGALAAATAMVTAGLLVMPATPAVADILSTPAPVEQRPASSVTADELPTVQIDTGVVWTQDIVGNTVYAGGQFTNTRPSGAAKGQNLTPRSNLLAYDIRTGDLITGFDHPVNGVVKAVKASQDGKRLYIGGTFTKVDGKSRYNVAAFDTATGELIDSFAPVVSGGYVNAIAATDTAVYLGGTISSVNGTGRTNLAAVSPTGATLAWAPTADRQVDAMVLADGGAKLVVGGRFARVNNAVNKGTAALNPSTGATMPWPLNQVVSNGGSSTVGIWSLSTDGAYVFGTAWAWGTGNANLEGSFSANAKTGELNTLNYVLGDNYGIYSDGTTQYQTSHTHDASIIGGYPNNSSAMPNGGPFQYSLAYTVEPKGRTNSTGYWNRSGYPAPAILNWYPRWYSGSFTGQGQAGWSITGDGRYVVVGGEFPGVNGSTQYGLTRFARTDLAPNKSGPRESGTTWGTPTFSSNPGGGRVKIRANWDRDDRDLTYQLIRSGTTKPVASTTVGSDSWKRATVILTDTSAEPGKTYTYQVKAVDAAGNSALSASVNGTASSTPIPDYAKQVLADDAELYWRMGGSQPGLDWAGSMDGTASSVSSAGTGAFGGDSSAWGTASTYNGSSSYLTAPITTANGSSSSIELWLRTTTSRGGELAGHGSSRTGASATLDQILFLRNDGKITFGALNGAERQTATTRMSYNDGRWHHVVATAGAKGLLVYVDGYLVGSNVAATKTASAPGYWRVGGDSLTGWEGKPTADYYAGDLDEFAVYARTLSKAEVTAHFSAGGGQPAGSGDDEAGDIDNGDKGGSSEEGGGTDLRSAGSANDAYSSNAVATKPDLYWRLNEAAGASTVADLGGKDNHGKVLPNVTFGASGPIGDNTAASFPGSSGAVASTARVDAPKAFTETAWFSSTSTSGGRIIGFGNSNTGFSSSYDRTIWMRNDGKLSFGVYPGSLKYVTSSASYNDGRWHMATASVSSEGMKLYVDGALVASNAQVTNVDVYAGYWKVGGDWVWNNASSHYLKGSIAEVMVHSRALSATDISNLHAIGKGTLSTPTAKFSQALDGATAHFDAGTSTASAGRSITSYAWDFGDGTSGAGKTVEHEYVKPGNYTVNLVITDDAGLAGAKSSVVKRDFFGSAMAASNPDVYWRLGDAPGSSTAVDSGPAGNHSKVLTNPGFGAAGAFAGTGAAALDGSNGAIVSPQQLSSPSTYSLSAWVKTTSTQGGRILGLANSSTGYSGNYDREIYLRSDGKLTFFVYPGTAKMLTTPAAYNDGKWHQFTATQGPSGMKIYADGALVASDPTVKTAQNTTGYWKLGNDNVWSGAGSSRLTGTIDEAAAYSRELAAQEIADLYAVSQGSEPPLAKYTQSVSGYTLSVDASASAGAAAKPVSSYGWDFGDGGTATGRTATHTYAKPGVYRISLRVADADGAAMTARSTVKVDYYPAAVKAAEPDLYWQFNDAAGSKTAADSSAFGNDGSVISTVTFRSEGAFAGTHGAYFDSSSGAIASPAKIENPSRYSLSAWVRTSSTTGGRILGLAGSSTGYSGTYDREIYLRSDGKLSFYVNSGGNKLITSPAAYNDGKWHLFAATQGADGMKLYVDGTQVAADASVTTARNFSGYWKVGADYVPTGASTNQLKGSIDEAAVFSRVLTPAEVSSLWAVANGAELPTAKFTAKTTGTSVALDASDSAAADGRTIASYNWDFGDGQNGNGRTATHTYTEIGDFPVVLTVTDNRGVSATRTRLVSISPAQAAPVAAIVATPQGMTVAFSGKDSKADEGGTITDWAWDFGDGKTGTGATTTHEYATSGTYTVKLTVTDNTGTTASTTTQVKADATIVSDDFDRDSPANWGTAPVGGKWTTSSGMAITNNQGAATMSSKGQTKQGFLTESSAKNADAIVDLTLASQPAGGSTMAALVLRHTGNNDYRVKAVVGTNQKVSFYLTKNVGGTETILKSIVAPGLTYTAGDTMRVRFQTITEGTQTTLKAKIWDTKDTEPTNWQLTTTDDQTELQTAGQVGLYSYLSSAGTNVPQTVAFDNLLVTEP